MSGFPVKNYSTVSTSSATFKKDNSKVEETSDLDDLFNTKSTITKENFDRAMNMVAKRPGGEYLAEKLSSKLAEFINKDMSHNDWSQQVSIAYNEILQELGTPTNITIQMAHPLPQILMATLWALP